MQAERVWWCYLEGRWKGKMRREVGVVWDSGVPNSWWFFSSVSWQTCSFHAHSENGSEPLSIKLEDVQIRSRTMARWFICRYAGTLFSWLFLNFMTLRSSKFFVGQSLRAKLAPGSFGLTCCAPLTREVGRGVHAALGRMSTLQGRGLIT